MIESIMIKQIIDYIRITLGIEINASEYADSHFPAFLGWSYVFYSFTLGEHSCLLSIKKPDASLTPVAIAKHVDFLAKQTGRTVIFGCNAMLAYERQRLMQRKIPFIIPGRQVYLPFLSIVLSEFGTKKQRTFDTFGNAAQVLLMQWLNNQTSEFSIAEAMDASGFTKPSVIRAFDELEFFGIARRHGKERRLHFLGDRATQWEEIRDKLLSPCRRIVGIEKLPSELVAIPSGTEALAMRSMLNPPECREFATFHTDYSRLRQEEIPIADAPVRLELWNYHPLVMSDGGVDPFSLWLTLKGDKDERVQICLDQMMKEVYDQRT